MAFDNTGDMPSIEIETAASPDASVILLHGLGDDGRGWSDIVRSLPLPAGAAIRFVFPHAPVMPVSINNGMRMRAWYDIKAANLNERADLSGVRASQAILEGLVTREVARGIPARRIVVAGFSQGGAIALYAGLRHRERLAGIVALSTYLIAADRIAEDASVANRSLPIFMAHGTYDPVVAFAWAERSRDVLKAAGWPLEWHAYPMEHSAVIEEIVAGGAFITRVLTERRTIVRQPVGDTP